MLNVNQQFQTLAKQVSIDTSYAYNSDVLRNFLAAKLAGNSQNVLDIANSSRELSHHFLRQNVTTLNVEDDGNTDVIADLCDIVPIKSDSFDGVICLSVLEHVYNPFLAVDNIHRILKDGGACFAQVPWIYHHHPRNRKYANFFNPSPDGLAVLFHNFTDVQLYSIRGKYSSMLNLIPMWKKRFDRPSINKMVDRVGGKLFGDDNSEFQSSGYFIWAVK